MLSQNRPAGSSRKQGFKNICGFLAACIWPPAGAGGSLFLRCGPLRHTAYTSEDGFLGEGQALRAGRGTPGRPLNSPKGMSKGAPNPWHARNRAASSESRSESSINGSMTGIVFVPSHPTPLPSVKAILRNASVVTRKISLELKARCHSLLHAPCLFVCLS